MKSVSDNNANHNCFFTGVIIISQCAVLKKKHLSEGEGENFTKSHNILSENTQEQEINSVYTSFFQFLKPPAQMNSAFKLRALAMKTKQAKQQVTASGYI